MSYELRVGLLAAIIIGVTVWGYKFMKGKNILVPSNTYYVTYTEIDELTATSPVLVRGLKVGTVAEIKLSEDLEKVTAKLDIQRGIKLARGTEALVVSTSIMGGKAVVLNTPGPCAGADCHEPGDYLPGRVEGLFESMLGGSDLDEMTEVIKEKVGEIFGAVGDSLTSENTASEIAKSFQDIQLILDHVEGITRQLNDNMGAYDRSLKGTLSNVDEFTGMLAENNEKIASTLDNLSVLMQDLRDADIGNKAADMMTSADEAVKSLEGTMKQAETTVGELKSVLEKINNGEGTLGMLTQDEELYKNLNSSVSNLDLLLQDFRLNPKRYVNVSVFGKKQKDYVVPEEDPAEVEEKN